MMVTISIAIAECSVNLHLKVDKVNGGCIWVGLEANQLHPVYYNPSPTVERC